MGANFSTQPTKESTSVEGREDVVKVVQSLKTRFDNSKAPDSHLSENVDTHAVECKNEAKVAGEGESQSGGIHSNPGGGKSSWGEKPEDGQSPLLSDQVEVKTMEKQRKMAQ